MNLNINIFLLRFNPGLGCALIYFGSTAGSDDLFTLSLLRTYSLFYSYVKQMGCLLQATDVVSHLYSQY